MMKNIGYYMLLAILFASCSAVKVNYDYEKTTDFSGYTTYNYYPDLNTGLGELDTKRLLKAVDAAMQAKGILLAEEPDFFINIQSSSFRAPRSNSSVGVGVGGGGRNVGGGVSIGIPVGQPSFSREIVFDFVDSQRDALFWQGVTESSYRDNASPNTREQLLNQIVTKVFSKYPPAIKK
ncbi:DUF4136 domain-containing protein [Spongiimicrobium sp. 3-5]|uniref:DUF4136 domain-containing protein n=1 Tax=Spongiimicrobium sp. 3-5 TaxID=3332596 RepID=UPI0039809862